MKATESVVKETKSQYKEVLRKTTNGGPPEVIEINTTLETV
jgi:hypothetical protein